MTEIMTVLGPIAPENLGLTSMHEHVLYDGTVYRQRFLDKMPAADESPVSADDKVSLENFYYHRQHPILTWDGCSMHDEAVMTAEMTDFKVSGGSALVDMSTPGLRSNLPGIQRISRKSGVHVVATTGLYSEDCWPDRFKNMSVREYENYMLGEIEAGIEDTGIKAGHIKVAIEEGPTEQGRKLLKAVARVSNKTGVSATIHHGIGMEIDGIRKIPETLLNEGMAPDRTIIAHMQTFLYSMDPKTLLTNPDGCKLNLDFNKEILDQGVNVAHDCFGHHYNFLMLDWINQTDWQQVAAIYALCREGYAGQIVLGTDTFLKILARRFGGGGYCHLTGCILPMFQKAGIAEADIRKMTVKTPARLLAKG